MSVRVAGAESMATAHDHSPQCVRGGHLQLNVREGRGGCTTVQGRVGSGQNCAANDSMCYAAVYPIVTRVPSACTLLVEDIGDTLPILLRFKTQAFQSRRESYVGCIQYTDRALRPSCSRYIRARGAGPPEAIVEAGGRPRNRSSHPAAQ